MYGLNFRYLTKASPWIPNIFALQYSELVTSLQKCVTVYSRIIDIIINIIIIVSQANRRPKDTEAESDHHIHIHIHEYFHIQDHSNVHFHVNISHSRSFLHALSENTSLANSQSFLHDAGTIRNTSLAEYS